MNGEKEDGRKRDAGSEIEGERKPEGASPSLLALHPDLSAVTFDDHFANDEAKPLAALAFARAASTSTSPPSSVNLMAFPIKLLST